MTTGSGMPDDGLAGDRGRDWVFQLFVAGRTPIADRTESNLRALVREHLGEDGRIEVVDLTEHPGRATTENIVAVPTVVRTHPEPRRSVVGDLSDTEQAVIGLELPR